jgi:hypothetical protein
MRPQSKEYPIKRFIPISRSDRVVQLYWYTPQDFGHGQPGPILGESMPNQSLMRGLTLDQFLTMRYNTRVQEVMVLKESESRKKYVMFTLLCQ